MSNPDDHKIVTSDPEGHTPPASVASPLGPCESDPPTCEIAKASVKRRDRRSDRDTALVDACVRFRRDFDALLQAASRRGPRSALDRDDVDQEAWLIFLARFRPEKVWDDEEEMRSWLAVVAVNRLANLKRRVAWRLQESLDDAEATALVGREEDPADADDRRHTRSIVREVLDEARERVPEPSHRIVILRWFEGRTVPEIAEQLGMTAAQVHDRHRRAISVLRALLIRRLGTDPIVAATSPEADSQFLDHEGVTP